MGKVDLNRQLAPEQPPELRTKNFQEVRLGLSYKQARAEADRCLDCIKDRCAKGCPAGNDIRGFIREIKEGHLKEALEIIRKTNPFPGITGRVCPRINHCEGSCALSKRGAAVAIADLERFVADWEMSTISPEERARLKLPSSGRQVAVIGSGPAGLTTATELARRGHQVALFEALPMPGGVLTYGIPAFRLPREVLDYEIEYLKHLGVDMRLNSALGKDFMLEDVFSLGEEAIFLAPGAWEPILPSVPGETLSGICTATEFLAQINAPEANPFPSKTSLIKAGEKVVVIGGGNVAIDAARCALRLGCDDVTIIYRRSKKEMTASPEEIKEAEDEGVKFLFLVSLKRFIDDGDRHIQAVECLRNELGDTDKTGRRRPISKPGSEFLVKADSVILALGSLPSPALSKLAHGLTENGVIAVDPITGRTRIPKVWAGGDGVAIKGTVAGAIAMAMRAAGDIDRYLRES